MKPTLSFAISLLALGTLLGAPAAATNVAGKPLKASVLAKPNVVFVMDDSGSLDWEVLLDTSSGVLWWNGASQTAWDTGTGKPLRTSSYVPYAYLFPIGTNTGGQLYGFNSSSGQAVPPTPQFAWTRSARFNPLYYDPAVTYKPWPKAYHGGATKSYADASPTAALGHPNYTGSSAPKLNLTAQWSSSSTNWDNRNGAYMFYVQRGVVVPSGSYLPASSETSGACQDSDWEELEADVTVASGRACWAAIPYFPATYWAPDSGCTVGTSSTSNCVLGPDGATKLKRHEIKSANYATTAEYNAAIQNFANWFTYYRKRKLMLAGSMGKTLEGLTGVRMGVVPFSNSTTAVTMFDADSASASGNGMAVAGKFYTNGMNANGTPTHAAVNYAGKQFDSNTSIVQYACQRNAMFVVTDGFANDAVASPPSYDASKYGSGAPYETIYSGTLADEALSFYTNRLRAGGGSALAAGKVPKSASTGPNADLNPDLHVNTYALTLGVRGSLWPNTVDPFDVAPNWTSPVSDDPSLIDDQWHGTINGRGKMYLASNPEETARGLQAALSEIISQTGAQGGAAVSTVNLSRGDSHTYYGSYDPAGWAGDLVARAIDKTTGAIGAQTWSAGAILLAREFSERVIATAIAGSGAEFGTATPGLGSEVNPLSVYGSDADVINYLRGDRSKEGTSFRPRTSLMGAVINSEPAVSNEDKVLYVQSSEGMLHAFDIKPTAGGGNPGKELWAFVPQSVLPAIGATTSPGYVFRTKLDGSPGLGKYSASGKLLVAGIGVAGKSFYALDVTSPRSLTQAQLATRFKWQFTDSQLGLAVGKPVIVKTADTTNPYVVLITSGYNSADGQGRLWMLDADTGAVLKTFITSGGSSTVDAGLAQVSGFSELDGTVRYVYGGDLLGNLWKFDLQASGTTPAPFKLAVLKDASNNTQPVTAAPELTFDPVSGKSLVVVGTGRLLDSGDFGSTQVQSLYVIADGASALAGSARSNLVQQTYLRDSAAMGDITVDWDTGRGWYVDMPAGEQINSRPVTVDGAVAWVGNLTGETDCTAKSWIYVMKVLSGRAYPSAGFVSRLLTDKANFSQLTALGTSDGHRVLAGQDWDSNPNSSSMSGAAPIMPSKNAWTEIRLP